MPIMLLPLVEVVRSAFVSVAHSATAAATAHTKITATKALVSAGHGAAEHVAWEAGKHAVTSGMLDKGLAGSHATAATLRATNIVKAGVVPRHAMSAAAQAVGNSTAQSAGSAATIPSASHTMSLHVDNLLLDGAFLGVGTYLGKKYDKRIAVRLEKTAKYVAKHHRVKRADIARALRLDPQGKTLRSTMNEAVSLGILSKATKATYEPGPALAA